MMITAQENEKLYYFLFPDEKPKENSDKPQKEET